jgi:hypothetical protein
MIKKIKHTLLVLATLLTTATPALVPVSAAFADCTNIANQVQNGANSASGGSDTCSVQTNTNPSDLKSIASRLVNFFSIIVGAVSVLMIIYGGFRYITSGGDSGRVGNAKNTLIYAIVGLIIVALAQVIVHFVLNNVGQVTPGTS